MSTAAPVTPDQFRSWFPGLVTWILALPALVSVMYVVPYPFTEAVGILGAAGVVAGAAGAVGSFIGFLFGVPKTLQSDQPPGAGPTYLVNTNLEQISDWLTKILVGIGLVQIAQVPDALGTLGTNLAPAFGGKDTSSTFAVCLALYFAISGLSLTYLWTRTFLSRILRASDQEQVTTQVMDILQVTADANAQALVLVGRALKGESPPPQTDLDAAIRDAARDVRVSIYQQAEDQRLRTWRNDPTAMARTIPVFRALAVNDVDEQFFRHFGSLGFSLKDQPTPDYPGALQALDEAIEIRERRGGRGLCIYEWNRAVCRIRLDLAFGIGRLSAPDVRDRIEADLRAAAEQLDDTYFHGGDDDKDALRDWMQLNQVDVASLRRPPVAGTI